ncbi:MAG: hemerythrin family protein [Deltaproteobacteria bacterium]|nr:hemerythrin family protein [Deltaproteobacteria bacterium]
MPILEWHERVYALGVEEIDCQHRALVGRINDAYDAAAGSQDPDRVRALVARMAAYAEGHFACEETVMREAGYEAALSHGREHHSFVRKSEDYAEALHAGRAPRVEEVFRYLAEWLSAHILEVDMAFGRWLKARGRS